MMVSSWECILSIDHSVETFRILPDFPAYRISNWGRVQSRWKRSGGPKSVLGDAWVDRTPNTTGKYPYVFLYDGNGGFRKEYIHTLVLENFVGPRPPGMEACHGPDRNPMNCHADNLRWDTHQANMDDMEIHGTRQRGISHPGAKLDEDGIDKVFSLRNEGLSHTEIAAVVGVSGSNVGVILSGKAWSHITGGASQAKWSGCKLDATRVMEIVKMKSEGHPVAKIAMLFNVSKKHIENIVYGHRWSHVTGIIPKSKRLSCSQSQ